MRMFDVNLKEGLHRHTIDQRLFDVTLATDDGKEIKAHKLILLAGSQFFMKLFVKNNPTRIKQRNNNLMLLLKLMMVNRYKLTN